jgi:hypothetical protein
LVGLVTKDWKQDIKNAKEYFETNALEKLTGKAWCSLLIIFPCYADRCNWSKLNDRDWESLLKIHPEFEINRK